EQRGGNYRAAFVPPTFNPEIVPLRLMPPCSDADDSEDDGSVVGKMIMSHVLLWSGTEKGDVLKTVARLHFVHDQLHVLLRGEFNHLNTSAYGRFGDALGFVVGVGDPRSHVKFHFPETASWAQVWRRRRFKAEADPFMAPLLMA